jgi:hypothetical protein
MMAAPSPYHHAFAGLEGVLSESRDLASIVLPERPSTLAVVEGRRAGASCSALLAAARDLEVMAACLDDYSPLIGGIDALPLLVDLACGDHVGFSTSSRVHQLVGVNIGPAKHLVASQWELDQSAGYPVADLIGFEHFDLSRDFDQMLEVLAQVAMECPVRDAGSPRRSALLASSSLGFQLTDKVHRTLMGVARLAGADLKITELDGGNVKAVERLKAGLGPQGIQFLLTWAQSNERWMAKLAREFANAPDRFTTPMGVLEAADLPRALYDELHNLIERAEDPGAAGLKQTTKAERRADGWTWGHAVEKYQNLPPVAFPEGDDRSPSPALILTPRAMRHLSGKGNPYDDPGQMWEQLELLATAAAAYRAANGVTRKPVVEWFTDFGLRMAPTDSTISQAQKTFTYKGAALSREPHIKVDDGRGLDLSGRIYFNRNAKELAIIVDHIGRHL